MRAVMNGASFRPKEAKDIIKSLAIGDELRLEREADNAYDSNAVKVLSEDGVHLGYIEASMAGAVAARLDEGESAVVVVDAFESTLKPILDITFGDEDEDYGDSSA